tara:strand:+ start:2568 stop:2873 length:306 start_codon:yes stop_codon:yes gene_type:complete
MANIPIYKTDWVNITQVFRTQTVNAEGVVTSLYTKQAAATIDKNRITAVGEFIDIVDGNVVTAARAIFYEGLTYPIYCTETLVTLRSWVNAIDCGDLCTDS